MTRMNKSDVEELISGYLDDRLSQRQHTEVERLMQHDKTFARKLARIEKQRSLLKAMPRVEAPENMFDDIKHFLDRKHHTDQAAHVANAGWRHLIGRKVLTSAAMFALVGLLAAVVINILMPISSPSDSKTVAKAPSYIANPASMVDVAETTELAWAELPEAYPINATLKLATSDVMSISSLIDKAIYNNGLLDYTVPDRKTERSRYQLTCSAESVIAFLSDIDIALSRSSDAELTVFGKDTVSKVVVEDVTTAEIADFYRSEPNSDHIQLAKQISGYKGIVKNFPSGDMTSLALLGAPSITGEIEVVKPVLTTGVQEDILRQLYKDDHRGDVTLTVIVTGF